MELKNQLVWSCSRAQTFADCRRKYFYSYYGSWGGWTVDAAPETKEIYLLKNLRSFPIVVGQGVHKSLDLCLRRLQKGETDALDRLDADYEREFDFAVRLSQQGMYKRTPKLGGISEYEYGIRVSSEDIQEHRAKGLACLRVFRDSKLLQEILESDSSSWKFPRNFATYQVGSDEAYAVFDFAYEKDGILTVIDFKTGPLKEDMDESQSLAYCHYFWKEEGWPASQIRFTYWSLDAGDVQDINYTETQLIAFEEQVEKEMAEMRKDLLDSENNIASIDNFPRTDEIVHCRTCKFRKCCR